MIGKKNIVFGFAFFILTALLGPYMYKVMAPKENDALQKKIQAFGELQKMQQNKFQDDLGDKLTLDKVGEKLANAIRAVEELKRKQEARLKLKSGAHAHGNLESLLNIVVGLALCFLAAPRLLKQAISWLFLLGALLHSGMAYLSYFPPFQFGWADSLLKSGAGPILLLSGLVLMAVAAARWLRAEVIKD